MSASLIQDPPALLALCRQLEDQPWVALDTEFMRERTYYARLCLIQVATPTLVACVDPLAVEISPLLDLLYAPTLLKVFHSARQDLEVLHDLRGAVLQPVFDTQIAAALTAPEDQIGYGALVEALTGHKLPKLHTRADWAARPLSPEQLLYAEDDVRYLCEIYRQLHERLRALGREAWLQEECAALTDPTLYRNPPEDAWRRLRAGQQLAPAAQMTLGALAAWRERIAKAQDLPRSWVLKDAVLFDLARDPPTDLEALSIRDGLSPGAARKWGREILAIIAETKTQAPARPWDEPVRFNETQQRRLKDMATRVHAVAATHGLSPTLLATRHDLQELILRGGGRLARGWRRALIGEELLAPIPILAPPVA
jgi:ribonuclease D